MKQKLKIKKNKIPVYEHLEHSVKNTTYAHRLQWLQEANEWVLLLENRRSTKFIKPANLP